MLSDDRELKGSAQTIVINRITPHCVYAHHIEEKGVAKKEGKMVRVGLLL